jgi:ribosome-associated protein
VTEPTARKQELVASARPASDLSRERAFRILQAALDKKAVAPVLLDVHESSSYTDYILLVSGRSDRQVEAIAEGVIDELARDRVRPVGVEGEGQWTLIDFGDVVVHVFYHPVREFYDLEGLWIDAPRIQLDLPPEAYLPAEVY